MRSFQRLNRQPYRNLPDLLTVLAVWAGTNMTLQPHLGVVAIGAATRRRHSARPLELVPHEGSAMLGWVGNIEQVTRDNDNFRTVIDTGVHSQLTVMSIPPGGEVGWEAHTQLDQFLRLEQGSARADFGRSSAAVDESHEIEDDWAIIVPAGVWHNIVNTGDEDLKLYSIYSPPEHADGTVHRTKAEADADEHHH